MTKDNEGKKKEGEAVNKEEERKLSSPTQYEIFCDLDGVLCDFNSKVKQLFHKNNSSNDDSDDERDNNCNDDNDDDFDIDKINPGILWSKVCKEPKFYETLPWTNDGKELWNILVQNQYYSCSNIDNNKTRNNSRRRCHPTVNWSSLNILTGVPRHKSSRREKYNWCVRELSKVTLCCEGKRRTDDNEISNSRSNDKMENNNNILTLKMNHIDKAANNTIKKKHEHTIVNGTKRKNKDNNIVINVITCWSKYKHRESFYNKKSNHRAVLIDDRIKLKDEWEEKGGIFIHHVNTKNTIKQLKEKGIIFTMMNGDNNVHNYPSISKNSSLFTNSRHSNDIDNKSNSSALPCFHQVDDNDDNQLCCNNHASLQKKIKTVCLIPLRKGRRLSEQQSQQQNKQESKGNDFEINNNNTMKEKKAFIKLWNIEDDNVSISGDDDIITAKRSVQYNDNLPISSLCCHCAGSRNCNKCNNSVKERKQQQDKKDKYIVLGRREIIETMLAACGCSYVNRDITTSGTTERSSSTQPSSFSYEHSCRDCQAVTSWALTNLSRRMISINKQRPHYVYYRGMNTPLLLSIDNQPIIMQSSSSSKSAKTPSRNNSKNTWNHWTNSKVPLQIGSVLTFGDFIHKNADAFIEYKVDIVVEKRNTNSSKKQTTIVSGGGESKSKAQFHCSSSSTIAVDEQNDNAKATTTMEGMIINETSIDWSTPKINILPTACSFREQQAVMEDDDIDFEIEGEKQEGTKIRGNCNHHLSATLTSQVKIYTQLIDEGRKQNSLINDDVIEPSSLSLSSFEAQQSSTLEPGTPKQSHGTLKDPAVNHDKVCDNVLNEGSKPKKEQDNLRLDSKSISSPTGSTGNARQQYILYFLQLGKSMPRSRITILEESARKKGAMVVDTLDASLQPTHIILEAKLDISTVSSTLGFASTDEFENFLSKRDIEVVVPEWLTSAGGTLQEPFWGHFWSGLSRTRIKKRKSSHTNVDSPIKRQRMPIDDMMTASIDDNSDIEESRQLSQPYVSGKKRPRNLALSDAFATLAKLHQDCPLDERDQWRGYSFNIISGRLRHLEFEITDDEEILKKVKGTKGFGTRIMEMITEYLRTGSIGRIKHFQSDPERVAMNDMMHIWGVGNVTARALVNNGYRTIEQVRNAVDSGRINPKLKGNQLIGLDCWEDFKEKMTREEVEKIGDIVITAFRDRYKQAEITIMGSYRRGKTSCGDVDILITHPSYVKTTPYGALGELVERLKRKGHIEHHLTAVLGMSHSDYTTDESQDIESVSCAASTGYHKSESYMGVFYSPVAEGKRRRVDIKIYPYRERIFASLYFTGNGWFNRSLRLYSARIKNLHLNDHGLFPDDGKKHHILKPSQDMELEATTEKEVFDFLGVEYKEPHERDCFDAVVPIEGKVRNEFALLEVKRSEIEREGLWVS